DFMGIDGIPFELIEIFIKQTITRLKRIVQDLETRLELKVPTEQMKNQTKAGYNHLHNLQRLCEDEERLLKEWLSEFTDSVSLSQEKIKQSEEAEDADIKGDKIQFSGTHLTGDKKRIYDDLGTSKMLTQDKIRPSEIYLRHAKVMALKEYDEKTQQALTQMLRPGPALLIESTDQKFDEQTIKSHHNILVSDHLFERDSNIVEDIKAFLSELTSHFETKLIKDPKLQSKIEQASSVSLEQPSEDELKRSMPLKLHKEKDQEESGPIKVQDEYISTSSQLPIKVQESASLQLRGERITLWCIQRIQDHFECITVQLKRIRLSLSRVYKSLNYIENENKNTTRKSLDLPTLTKEWSHVKQLAQDCKNSNDMIDYTHSLSIWSRHRLDHERVERLREILKELETKI
ncbi:uncharacterized protein LOC132715304, partial [Ruditapes philippinarum]|uniref:uncharacterized protein LOC132715304 n=1 Tax=Ruditapes philippinarum TaxID=129788 RepID=UPI00295B81ED